MTDNKRQHSKPYLVITHEDAAQNQQQEADAAASEHYNLRLYVAGQTAKSAAAIVNLRRICEEHLAGRFTIEVVDLLVHPQLAAGDQILAVPTLVRRLPPPLKRVIGSLADTERVLVGLDLRSGHHK
ncbi:circadian clock protein KaiB [Dankookia rubra]|uniref:Circadian clock protein KaiB n=1 Tax=Dankookia rubra TaxID=1442381 RepID=A0A4R5QCK2_9PROT|nr:circadian clock KaiB family protein [Dankookia rubra]TDH60503.1 circadian clock protein KaiB [Dankookia rubra]